MMKDLRALQKVSAAAAEAKARADEMGDAAIGQNDAENPPN